MKVRGWLTLLLAIVFTLFGLAFGLAEYFIAAAVCALFLLVALLQVAGQRPQFKLETVSNRMAREQMGKILLIAHNLKPWPLFPLRLRITLQKEDTEPSELAYLEIALKPKEKKTIKIDVVCPHRGDYTVFLLPYCAEDIFGFFALPGQAMSSQKLLSLPQLTATPLTGLDSSIREEEESWQGLQGHLGQLIAESRLYQQGDALRTIHWKKSASRRALFSRLRESTTDYSCCLLLDNRLLGEGEEALNYEDCLCEVALSFLFAQLTNNQTVTLLPGGTILQAAQSIDKAAELLATMPFSADTVFGELKSLLESPHLPSKLYIALAQSVVPLLPLLEQITERGCSVVLLAPTDGFALADSGLQLSLPVINVDPPQIL